MLRRVLAAAAALWLLGAVCVAQAAGSVAAGKAKSGACVACHGADGNDGINPLWPKLAGQIPEYITKQLQDFKSGARQDPLMSGIVAGLSPQDMQDLGAYFGSLPTKPGAASTEAMARLGERIYRGGDAENGVSACMSCHGPSGKGIPIRFPRVSGQNAEYTRKQLLAFKRDQRTNDGEVMTRIAFRMSEQQINAVAQYMQGLH